MAGVATVVAGNVAGVGTVVGGGATVVGASVGVGGGGGVVAALDHAGASTVEATRARPDKNKKRRRRSVMAPPLSGVPCGGHRTCAP